MDSLGTFWVVITMWIMTIFFTVFIIPMSTAPVQ